MVPRVVLVLLAAAVVAGGCGADRERGADATATQAAKPAPRPSPARRQRSRPVVDEPRGATTEAEPVDNAAAVRVATYKLEVDAALDAYARAQRRAFAGLGDDAGADRVLAAVQRLRASTDSVAERLRDTAAPPGARSAHARFVRAFRSLSGVLRSAIAAREQRRYERLRAVGRRLVKGDYSRPITRAAAQIDAALAAAAREPR